MQGKDKTTATGTQLPRSIRGPNKDSTSNHSLLPSKSRCLSVFTGLCNSRAVGLGPQTSWTCAEKPEKAVTRPTQFPLSSQSVLDVCKFGCMEQATNPRKRNPRGPRVLRQMLGRNKDDVCQANIDEWMRCQLEQADLEAAREDALEKYYDNLYIHNSNFRLYRSV